MTPPSGLDECYSRYGKLQTCPEGGIVWKEATTWIKPLDVPGQIVLRNTLGKMVYRIYCNTDIHAPLSNVFQRLITEGTHTQLETFDGCFNVRWVRGRPGIPSYHSWGIALDFNAKTNPLGGKSSWSEEFVKAFEEEGFYWGGHYTGRKDPMHFEWVQPGRKVAV